MLKQYPIENIDLFITEQCNLNCSYCFHPKTAAVMSIDEGKKIIDRLKELYPEKMGFTFFGGEPMLYPETVLALAEYAIPKWERCWLTVVTNGTYFDEQVFDRMKELGFAVQVSIDGDRETNTTNRGGDFDKICENAKNILKMFPDASVRMTYTPENVFLLGANVQFLHTKLGFKKIMHHAVIEANWTNESTIEYYRQLELLYSYYQYCIRNGIRLELAFIDKAFTVLGNNSKKDEYFCGAGRTYVAILNNGDVYPCHRAASSRTFKLGNIFEEIPLIRGMFLTMDKGAFPDCVKCEAINTCHACIITNHKVNGALTVPVAPHCGICRTENSIAKKFFFPITIDKLNYSAIVQQQEIVSLEQKIDVLSEITSKLFQLVRGEK